MPHPADMRFGSGGAHRAYRITLACGHAVRTRTQPWRSDSRYPCPAGQGCGYRVAWTSWTCGEARGVNPGQAAANLPPAAPSPQPEG